MKSGHQMAALIIVLGGFTITAPAQTIFNENFDGGYTGGFSTSSYSGGSPTDTTNHVITTGGDPNGAWQESMKANTASDYYAGQVQLRRFREHGHQPRKLRPVVRRQR